MIKQAMTYIANELMLAKGLNEGDVTIDSFLSLRKKRARGIVISLFNVEEEPSLKNDVVELLPGTRDNLHSKELLLDLNIIIIFDFEDYSLGLEHLASIAGYFYRKPVYSENVNLPENPFPPGLSAFSVSLVNLNIDMLNRIWSICGGIHYPALFYKMRFLHKEQEEKQDVPEVKTNRIIRDPLSIQNNSSTDIN